MAVNSTGQAISTVVINKIEGRPLDEGVAVSIVAGAIVGGIAVGNLGNVASK